jgi:hypothetical protein
MAGLGLDVFKSGAVTKTIKEHSSFSKDEMGAAKMSQRKLSHSMRMERSPIAAILGQM